MLSLRFLSTILLTILAAGACVIVYWQLQLRLGDDSSSSAALQVLGALAVCMLPLLVAPDDEKRLCVAVAATPLMLILAAYSVASLSGKAPLLALAQFVGLGAALALVLWGVGRRLRRRTTLN
jgi:VIT1/CCC1 family predicted Fe2+/Mn2+ transporter